MTSSRPTHCARCGDPIAQPRTSVRYYCHACSKQRTRERDRLYYRANRDQCRERVRRWCERNRHRVNELHRRWRIDRRLAEIETMSAKRSAFAEALATRLSGSTGLAIGTARQAVTAVAISVERIAA